MNIARFFIDRPIFAAVISIVITLLGSLALLTLPIAQYPDIVPPTVKVSASYPGANAQTVADTVAAPIEQEVNGVEDMLYMSSQSANDGSMVLTITFKLGTDPDEAQVLVQNRVSIAEPRLPEEVRRQGVTTKKSSPDLSLVVALSSPKKTYDSIYLSNYALLQIKDVLARVDGVGDLTIFGARDYSMRVWLDPERIASLNMTADDVVNALREQNVQVAAGTIGQPPVPKGTQFQFTVNTMGRLTDPEQFANIIIKTGNEGRITRVRDIARVELAAKDYGMSLYLDGGESVGIGIYQRPGSNALATKEAIVKAMDELKKRFPKDLEYSIPYDTTVFVEESVNAVVHTLFEAIVLVVIVVLIFLQNWRSTIIPLLAVPVSLVGTFAVMALLGFSLNNLSLFGLVLAIGIVVDDAIVVVENVERNMALGHDPRTATQIAMDEVSGPVVAIAIVLSAVFVPVAFIPGISGEFYRQFALTIAVSTIISAFNSLTLSPALAALMLQPHHARKDWLGRLLETVLGRFFKGFNTAFDRAGNAYANVVTRITRLALIGLAVYAGLLFLTYVGFTRVPSGFIPAQDKGYLMAFIQLPDGASLQRTNDVAQRVSQMALATPGVGHTVAVVGFSVISGAQSSNSATVFLPLKPFNERGDPALRGRALIGALMMKVSTIQEAVVAIFPPPPVSGIGSLGGFKLMVQDRGALGTAALQGATENLIAAGNAQPGLQGLFTTTRASVPQLYLDIDRTKAKSMGVPLSNVFDTLSIYLGGSYVNDFNIFGRPYQVRAQADSQFRVQPEDIVQLKTRNATGGVVPLGTLVDVREITGPDRITRYNMFPAAEINGNTAPGYSSGQAIALMEQLGNRELPQSMSFEWTELTYQQILAGNLAVFIFPLCVLLVFLALAALYESWSLPMAIILIVPMCLLCAITGVGLRGFDNNIFTQIGFVVLVGLACKNAILIVEFAKAGEDEGKNRFDAVVEASRLRPILMTSFAFIMGVVPLMLAQGAGAEMRTAIGTAVFSGMLGVTFFGLLLTPIFYVVIRGLAARGARKKPDTAHGHPAPEPA